MQGGGRFEWRSSSGGDGGGDGRWCDGWWCCAGSGEWGGRASDGSATAAVWEVATASSVAIKSGDARRRPPPPGYPPRKKGESCESALTFDLRLTTSLAMVMPSSARAGTATAATLPKKDGLERKALRSKTDGIVLSSLSRNYGRWL